MQNTTLTVNLKKKLLRLHTRRRRKRAVGLVREAVARFTKSDVGKVKINSDLNQFIERNASGASFLWARLRVSVEKGDDKVEVKLYTPKTGPVSTAAPKSEEKKNPKAEESKKTEKQA